MTKSNPKTKGCEVTRATQLANKANFVGDNGKLYLVRCMACGNKENWAPAVASGSCAWCGWKESPPLKAEANDGDR